MLSDNRTQGEAIGFAQFMSRNFCREIPNGFSNFWALVINKRLLVQPCPLQTVVIWVTVWVSGFLSKSALTILATKQRKVPKPWWFRNFYGCGGRTRTYDLRVMSPTSFQLLHPATIFNLLLEEWAEVDSNHRSKLQQIYSLSPLATRESAHNTKSI